MFAVQTSSDRVQWLVYMEQVSLAQLYCTVLCRRVPYSTVQYHTVQSYPIQYHTVLYSTVSNILHRTAQPCNIESTAIYRSHYTIDYTILLWDLSRWHLCSTGNWLYRPHKCWTQLKSRFIKHYYFLMSIVTLYHTALHYTTPHCLALHHTTLQYTTPNYTTLHGTTSHYTTLHYTKLDHTAWHYTTQHYTTLHHTTSHCTALHHTAWYCNLQCVTNCHFVQHIEDSGHRSATRYNGFDRCVLERNEV